MLSSITSASQSQRPFTPSYMDRSAAGHSPYGLPVTDNCITCKLRNSNFSCALCKPSLEGLDQIKHATAYPEGAMIFVEGQTPRGVYILCQGRAKLMTTNSDGRSLIVKIAEPGDILGLHAVVSGKPYELAVETLQPSQLAFIGREDFLRFLKSHGDACLQATQQLSQECQSAYDVIRSIGLSHSVSAQLIGTSRETVTRTLSQFKKQRVLELSGSTLIIRNKAALEQMVRC